MWWYGRGNSGGSWLPEEKKLICGTEGEIVVAHGRLPSPAPMNEGLVKTLFSVYINDKMFDEKGAILISKI